MWSYEMFFAVVAGLAVTLYYVRIYFQGGQFRGAHITMAGKVAVVTGANTGIGLETALDLARRGARVHMACRDAAGTGERARQQIVEETGNRAVFVWQLDLGSLQSVRDFAERFLLREPRLDVLINNAGVMNVAQSRTRDGFETHLGVNHLGHFLLTCLLLDRLRRSSSGRIVVVASEAHRFTGIRREDLMRTRSYNSWTAYCQSKLANVLFARQLARVLAGSGVSVYAVHPGVVASELMRHSWWLQRLVVPPILWLFYKTCKAGAQTQLRCACDPALAAASVSGRYWSDCVERGESAAARDDGTAEWLWRTSEVLVGLGPMNLTEESTKL